MTIPKPDFLEIFRVLAAHQIDFIVVGGVCGVLHGAPVTTFDLDLVHSRAPENLTRLAGALEALGAHYRAQGSQQRRPDMSHLSSPGHQLLMTRYGPLDLLGTIGNGHEYGELIENTEVLDVASGVQVRILNLAALIDVKEETAREKDKVMLLILRRTLEEKSKTS